MAWHVSFTDLTQYEIDSDQKGQWFEARYGV